MLWRDEILPPGAFAKGTKLVVRDGFPYADGMHFEDLSGLFDCVVGHSFVLCRFDDIGPSNEFQSARQRYNEGFILGDNRG